MKKPLYIAVAIAGFAACAWAYISRNELFVYPELRTHIAQGLKDPTDASFRSERMTPDGWLCGEVNAKNGYGAYTGFKRFMSASSSNAYVDGLGYVGAEKARASRDLVFDLGVQNEVHTNALRAARDSGGAITYTQDQIDRLTENAIFERRWSQICS